MLTRARAQVSERLPEAGSPGVRAKLVALLQAAARGIGANPTAAPADVLLFVHGVLETGMAAEEDAALRARAAAEAVGQATIGAQPLLWCSCAWRLASLERLF